MTAQVRLSLYNKNGALAAIVDDNDGTSIDLVMDRTRRSPKTLCKRAAATLRKLADKFDELAATEEPFKVATQKQVNRSKGSSSHAEDV